jgi:uncharacterized membrane protein
MRIESIAAIFGMAGVTYLTRSSGLWLMRRIKLSKRFQLWLSHIPAAIFVSILAPAVLLKGVDDAIASLAVFLIMARSGNLLLSMSAGVGAAWALRNFITP